MKDNLSKLYSSADIANIFGVSFTTVSNWRKKTKTKPLKLNKYEKYGKRGKYFFSAEQIVYMASYFGREIPDFLLDKSIDSTDTLVDKSDNNYKDFDKSNLIQQKTNNVEKKIERIIRTQHDDRIIVSKMLIDIIDRLDKIIAIYETNLDNDEPSKKRKLFRRK